MNNAENNRIRWTLVMAVNQRGIYITITVYVQPPGQLTGLDVRGAPTPEAKSSSREACTRCFFMT